MSNKIAIGKIKVSYSFIEKYPSEVRDMFKWLNALVLEATPSYVEHCIEYTIISARFRVVPEGEIIPTYIIYSGTEFSLKEEGLSNAQKTSPSRRSIRETVAVFGRSLWKAIRS